MKTTLIWTLFCMAFSLGIVWVEAERRADHIEAAVVSALNDGLYAGCDELTNPTRFGVQRAISNLELLSFEMGLPEIVNPVTGDNGFDLAREAVEPLECESWARHRTDLYYPDGR